MMSRSAGGHSQPDSGRSGPGDSSVFLDFCSGFATVAFAANLVRMHAGRCTSMHVATKIEAEAHNGTDLHCCRLLQYMLT